MSLANSVAMATTQPISAAIGTKSKSFRVRLSITDVLVKPKRNGESIVFETLRILLNLFYFFLKKYSFIT